MKYTVGAPALRKIGLVKRAGCFSELIRVCFHIESNHKAYAPERSFLSSEAISDRNSLEASLWA
ncbi:MAG: hypothetical protein AB1751_06685 [Acidobacteriota bacterium]